MASATAGGTRPPGAGDSLHEISATAGTPARSRAVRKILRLEARAQELLARYARALDTATRAKAQAYVLLDDAQVLEASLTGAELEEVRRGRAEALGVPRASAATPPDRPVTTTPT